MRPHSVVIITRRQNDNLQYIIDSVKNQTVQAKIIVIKDMERSAARNAGYKKASHDIVTFLDGDIVLLTDDYLEIAQSIITEKMILMGNRIDINRDMIGEIDQKTIKSLFKGELNNLNFGCFESNNFTIIKNDKEFFDENFKGWAHEDVELSYRYINDGWTLKKDLSLIAGHISHPSSVNAESLINNGIYFIQKHPFKAVYEMVKTALEYYNIGIKSIEGYEHAVK